MSNLNWLRTSTCSSTGFYSLVAQLRLRLLRNCASWTPLYVLVNWISFGIDFTFKFVCLSIGRVPLLARRPDQFQIQIQNPHLYLLVNRNAPLLATRHASFSSYSDTIRASIIYWVLISLSRSIQNCLTNIRDRLSIDIVITIDRSKLLDYPTRSWT